ncbi:hypothetical protein AVEN_249860-1 [Araneus ventricosus]|uniref:Uncharacterized protein n=1 Tax=Araneus ventricosus TaxID=182803 RepID=A0A4Y2LFP9_ARAVE|nr:hypothetical protein AVEN_249860-1 [Araneus ventricosus]
MWVGNVSLIYLAPQRPVSMHGNYGNPSYRCLCLPPAAASLEFAKNPCNFHPYCSRAFQAVVLTESSSRSRRKPRPLIRPAGDGLAFPIHPVSRRADGVG